MYKEIRIVSEDKNTMQITCPNERWYITYARNDEGAITEVLKQYRSVTWITSYCPMDEFLMRIIAKRGWDESEDQRMQAGNKGSRVHNAIHDLVLGNKVTFESEYLDQITEETRPLTGEEYAAVLTFKDWFEKTKPKVIDTEFTVYNDEYMYAGTVDLLCEIEGKRYIIDYKTSAYTSVPTSHKAQLDGYKMAKTEDHSFEDCNLAILQIGYPRNKAGYKFNEIDHNPDRFLACNTFWHEKVSEKQKQVFQKDFPTEISLY